MTSQDNRLGIVVFSYAKNQDLIQAPGLYLIEWRITRLKRSNMLRANESWCRLIRDTLLASGLDADALMTERGIGRHGSSTQTICAMSDAFSQVWDDALALSCNEELGLHIPSNSSYGLGNLAQLVLSAATIKKALEGISNHIKTIAPTESLQIRYSGNVCMVELAISPGSREIPSVRYDFLALVLLQSLRALTGCSITVLEYHRPGSRPCNVQAWSDAFEGPIRFDSSCCMIVLPATELKQMIPTANSTIFDLCERSAKLDWEHRSDVTTAYVRRTLETLLKNGEPRREDVASNLGLSNRSLSRRLASEGTSFARLVNEVRRDLAEHYLKNADLNSNEITFALGFGDPSNFYRACKRWFGCTPSGLRQ